MFEFQIEMNRRALIADVLRRLEEELWPFQYALDLFLATLFQSNLPHDWRERLHTFVDEQEAEGFTVDPKSLADLELWIEAWAADCDLLALTSPRNRNEQFAQASATQQTEEHHAQPAGALIQLLPELETLPPLPPEEMTRQELGGPRGDQSQFAREAEKMVSELTGIPLNELGPNQQSIRGSGPGGVRYLDLKVRGRDGSLRLRGSVVEVKASKGKTFGKLPKRSRQQLDDAVKHVMRVREKASLVRDRFWKRVVGNAFVEVFSDLPAPKSGKYFRLIEKGLLEWTQIPYTVAIPSPHILPPTAVVPRVTAAEDFAMGVVISIAEADVANEAYRESARALNGLLTQIRSRSEATREEWLAIRDRIKEIESMEQSVGGHIVEFFTYGQGSLPEKKAHELGLLAEDLAEKFGYGRVKTWGDIFTGGWGKFEKTKD